MNKEQELHSQGFAHASYFTEAINCKLLKIFFGYLYISKYDLIFIYISTLNIIHELPIMKKNFNTFTSSTSSSDISQLKSLCFESP